MSWSLAPKLVLFVVRPAEGGMRQHVLSLLEELDRSRFIPVVACPPVGDWPARLTALGIDHHSLDISAAFSPLADFRAAGRLRVLSHRLKPDLIHCHGAKAAFVARLAAGKSGLPVLYTVHGAGAPSSRWKAMLVTLSERRLAGRTAGYIAVSSALADGVENRWGVGSDRVAVIYNGIASDRFADLPEQSVAKRRLGLDPASPVVGMLARVVREKGPDVFVRAAALIAARLPGCQFVLAGNGPAWEDTRRLARETGVAGSFLFPGYHGDVPGLLAALDVFVQPSRSEGLGIGILEAMAAGRAVVASRTGGIPEIVQEGVTGLLVTPGAEEQLAGAIIGLLADDGLRGKLAMAGQLRVRREFEIGGAVRATEGVYERLLSHPVGVRLGGYPQSVP